MQFPAVLLALLVTGASAAQEHPIGKVIKLLEELQNQVWDESQEEQDTYRKFKAWCDESLETLDGSVGEDKDAISSLTDTVSAKTTEKGLLEDNIEHLTDEIKKYENEESDAKKAREDANKVYEEANEDFEKTVKAVDEAITALMDSKAAALVQFLKPENTRQEHALRQLIQMPLVLEQLSDDQRDALSAAVFGEKPVTEADILAKEKYAKAGNTYTFKSGGVIDLLRSLKKHFENEKTAATKGETAAANEYAVAKNARKDAIEAANSAKTQKEKDLGETEKELVEAESDLSDSEKELEADSKTLEDTTKTCDLKAAQFKERTTIRHHELQALKSAQEILAKIGGVRHEVPEGKDAPEVPSFLQIVSNPKKMKAVQLLRQEAKEEKSKALSRFADQLAAKLEDGPFDQINGMVQKMIFRLMDEQKDEDEHKLWCDKELQTSKTSRDDKTDKKEMLDAKIDEGNARVEDLTMKIKDLEKKVSNLDKFMKEATEVRAENKKENEHAIKDAETAQAAIAKAITVLETHYKESGMMPKEDWEFVQIKKEPEPVVLPAEPSSWDKEYTGVADPENAGTGVIAVLKETAADFSKMEADTRANEISDQEGFDSDMSDAKIEKAKSSKEAEMKTDEKKRTISNVDSMKKTRKHTVGELEAVNKYLEDLKPACVDGDSSYEDRKKARAAEIKALKEAQVILQEAFAEKDAKLLQINKH